MFNEFEVVEVAKNLPEYKLRSGQVGTVVEIYENPSRAYEVEFCNSEGETLVSVTLADADLRSVHHQMLLAA